MSGIVLVFIILGVWFIIVVASFIYREHYGIGKVKIQFLKEESGTTVHAGQGSSLGEAMVDGFRKLYGDLSPASRLDTIQVRYRAMQKSLAENRGRMFQEHITVCESYLRKTKSLLDEKQAEADKREAERWKKEQEARERRTEQLRRRQQKEKERAERERQKPEHDRFVAEQRRKMSDKLRYEVMRRDGFRCQLCGATQADGYKLHVDHIIPVSKGGKTEMSNLRTLCERCNLGKGADIEETPPNLQTSNQRATSYDAAMRLLREKEQSFVDKTGNGGSLYFFSETIARELKTDGYAVYFAPNGTKGTDHRAAWFVK